MQRVMKGVMFVLMFVVFCFLIGFVVEQLWNWLMPPVFGLKTITYWQAVGLLVLSKILLGGFHKHGRGGGGRGWERGRARNREWKRRMQERWEAMSEEERAAFRAGMKGRWGCGFGRDGRGFGREEPVTRETSAQ